MSRRHENALKVLDKLYRKIPLGDYLRIKLGLDEIYTVSERDAMLEAMWEKFDDVQFDPVSERILEPFMSFPEGTEREDIWHWFDERYSKGVAALLYPDQEIAGDKDVDCPLLAFIREEVPYRLDVMEVPEEKITEDLIRVCTENLYANSEIMFNYEGVENFLWEIVRRETCEE